MSFLFFLMEDKVGEAVNSRRDLQWEKHFEHELLKVVI